ncbi:hypothetical protein PAPYR_2489 [Paratrimastix pyriformis]|uniref:Uncharacterized protein n=1 Tax=Paratrimastix pyriformis TaxID=342808 RepID=A0ABQ8URA1_9EUKA|nr:hypothetical protein PAPYR_2489 [Paratrimastix pyriformis]
MLDDVKEACERFSAQLRGTFGPLGLDKLIVSPGKALVTKAGAKIAKSLPSDKSPISRFILRHLDSFAEHHGDHISSFLLMLTELVSGFHRVVHDQHASQIRLIRALSFILSAPALQTDLQAYLQTLACHTLSRSQKINGCPPRFLPRRPSTHITQLPVPCGGGTEACDARIRVDVPRGERASVGTNDRSQPPGAALVHVTSEPDPRAAPLSLPPPRRLVRLHRHHPDYTPPAPSPEGSYPLVLVVDCPLGGSHHPAREEDGIQGRVVVQVGAGFGARVMRAVTEADRADQLAAFLRTGWGVAMVLCSYGASTQWKQALADAGIGLAEYVPPDDLTNLCADTGTVPLYSLHELTAAAAAAAAPARGEDDIRDPTMWLSPHHPESGRHHPPDADGTDGRHHPPGVGTTDGRYHPLDVGTTDSRHHPLPPGARPHPACLFPATGLQTTPMGPKTFLQIDLPQAPRDPHLFLCAPSQGMAAEYREGLADAMRAAAGWVRLHRRQDCVTHAGGGTATMTGGTATPAGGTATPAGGTATPAGVPSTMTGVTATACTTGVPSTTTGGTTADITGVPPTTGISTSPGSGPGVPSTMGISASPGSEPPDDDHLELWAVPGAGVAWWNIAGWWEDRGRAEATAEIEGRYHSASLGIHPAEWSALCGCLSRAARAIPLALLASTSPGGRSPNAAPLALAWSQHIRLPAALGFFAPQCAPRPPPPGNLRTVHSLIDLSQNPGVDDVLLVSGCGIEANGLLFGSPGRWGVVETWDGIWDLWYGVLSLTLSLCRIDQIVPGRRVDLTWDLPEVLAIPPASAWGELTTMRTFEDSQKAVRGTLRQISFDDIDNADGDGIEIDRLPTPTADALAALAGPCKCLVKLSLSARGAALWGCGRTEGVYAPWVDETFTGHTQLAVLRIPLGDPVIVALLPQILGHLPSLEDFSIELDACDGAPLDVLLDALVRCCPRLEALNLGVNRGWAGSVPSQFTQRCGSQLKRLTIPCSLMKDDFVRSLTNLGQLHLDEYTLSLAHVASHLTHLTLCSGSAGELDIGFTRLESFSDAVSSADVVRLLAANRATIRSLSVQPGGPFDPLFEILDACSVLTHLDLTFRATAPGVVDLADLPPSLINQLQSLRLSSSLTRMAPYQSPIRIVSANLRRLDLDRIWLDRSTSVTLDCPVLEVLALPGSADFANPPSLGEQSLKAMPRLVRVDYHLRCRNTRPSLGALQAGSPRLSRVSDAFFADAQALIEICRTVAHIRATLATFRQAGGGNDDDLVELRLPGHVKSLDLSLAAAISKTCGQSRSAAAPGAARAFACLLCTARP